MNAKLKYAVQHPWEMARHLHLPTLVSATDAQQVRKALDEIQGIEDSVIDLTRRRLLVRYDVRQLDYMTLLGALENAGYPASSNLLDRICAKLYQYVDTNARENAKAPPPACCNKPPR
ncbi:heavy-metal-associated domain-containing protein [Thiolapillus brandeum]|uniref:HMA domain-containing protein n=1 Tax=Thiolapillus brandeum TaxID=1076588 RepID=A0A7U6GIS0_9GAMM|nr:heavy metal-associated domain-containing protein [Thiolapillus brandeum]BAO44384.1 hypothetical protein TBH_C1461 [Thiolapillus brandeum]